MMFIVSKQDTILITLRYARADRIAAMGESFLMLKPISASLLMILSGA